MMVELTGMFSARVSERRSIQGREASLSSAWAPMRAMAKEKDRSL